MSRSEKLIERFKNIPRDFTWDELVALLKLFGYEEIKTSKTGGSRRKFINEKNDVISLHKPHPSPIVKRYVIEIVMESLKNSGSEL